MAKNCIILHGCPSIKERALPFSKRSYHKHWIQWVQRELVARGIDTSTPLMPEPWAPSFERFKDEFEKCRVSEKTTLIGHSCGCAFLVRWLGESKQHIDTLILVAPWKIATKGDSIREQFYNYPIDTSIKERVKRIIIFTADDEEVDGKKSVALFEAALGGTIVELQGHGHYTYDDMDTEEFPELLQKIVDKQ